MLVSHTKKFIFLKTISAAGSSIESYLEKYCMDEAEWELRISTETKVSEYGIIGQRFLGGTERPEYYAHQRATMLKPILGDDIWNNYFKICSVRNPYEKLISTFFKLYPHMNSSDPSLDALFYSWVTAGQLAEHSTKDSVIYTIDNELCVDYVIRYENLYEDMNEVCTRLDINWNESLFNVLKKDETILPSKDDLIKRLITPEIKEIIDVWYAFELSHFNYQYPE